MRVTKQLTLDWKLMSLTIAAEISPSSVRGLSHSPIKLSRAVTDQMIAFFQGSY